jgi:imidazolonepropionase-like amidohydrolase
MRSGRLAAVGAVILAGSGATAAPVTIHAGRLMAVPGQTVRGPSTIVVDNGRIVSVTAGYQPAAGQLIDLRDKTVLPGLIDAHVHLTSDRAGNEGLVAEVTESTSMRAFETELNGMKTLRSGFTTVRNLGDGSEGSTLAYRDAIARGWVKGPRIMSAAQSLSTTGGHMDGRNGCAHVHSPPVRWPCRLPTCCPHAGQPRRRRDQDRNHRRGQQRNRPPDADGAG